MDLIAKFYYEKMRLEPIGSFYNFKKSLWDKDLDYLVLDIAEGNLEKDHCLKVMGFSKNPGEEKLKTLFSSVLSHEKFFPYMVKCKDKNNYKLIEEILKEKRPEVEFPSKGILERLFNIRFFL